MKMLVFKISIMKKFLMLLVALAACLSLNSCVYYFSKKELARNEFERTGNLTDEMRELFKIDISKRSCWAEVDNLEDEVENFEEYY